MDLRDPTGRVQVGIALQEALTNALFHGNLEVSSELRQHDEREFDELAERRRAIGALPLATDPRADAARP